MPHTEPTALHRAALAAAARGWCIFPLVPGDKRPAVRDWAERATTDPERIARCWAHAPYNIGIATGPSRLVVIDLDTPKSADDLPDPEWSLSGVTDGLDVFTLLCERAGQPVPTDTHAVRTRSGGLHLYFTAPKGAEVRNTAGRYGWKVDTRAAGGYVVGAGSTVGGRSYDIAHDAAPQPLPAWLAELFRPAPLPPQKPVTVALAADRRGSYLRAAVNDELTRVATSPAGRHNTALYLASVALGQLTAGGELSEADVAAWLMGAALQVGQSAREAQRTIESGLRSGAKRPRTVAA